MNVIGDCLDQVLRSETSYTAHPLKLLGSGWGWQVRTWAQIGTALCILLTEKAVRW